MPGNTPPILPRNATVIEITRPGGPEVLVAKQRPLPRPGPDQVLIRVAAAGVNRPDLMQRQGLYPPPAGASDIPGLEVSGTVVARGAHVSEPPLGAPVCALLSGGGYSHYAVAEAALCLPLPAGMNLDRAAALPETFFTVWSNVFDRGGLKRGERFLVHGGGSGIGTTAIQLAHTLGAEVFTTAGSEEKCQACRQLGADHAINYREQDFVEAIQSATSGTGVNLILDIVGGDYLERNLRALALEGRLVQIAVQAGPKTQINLLPILLKRLTLTGSTLRPRSTEFKAAIAANLRQKVWPLLESGQVRPVIHTLLPLNEAAAAHRLMESSRHIGKILLLPEPD